MQQFFPFFLKLLWAGTALFGAAFVITSLTEYKPAAAIKAALTFAGLLLALTVFMRLPLLQQASVQWGLALLSLAVTLLLLLPWGNHFPDDMVGEKTPIDERDAIFHRFLRLKPGMKEFDLFYNEHPELRAVDDEIRQLPGLMGADAETFNAATTPFNVATFDVMEKLYHDIDWTPEPLGDQPVEEDPALFSRRVKGFGCFAGADLAGITAADPAFIYTHIGRSPGPWGEPIELSHPHAIVLGVEMDHKMIRQAPHHAATSESSYRYMKVGQAALVLSRYIQRMGYEARAHIDGNYRVICPPLAVAAGLGELSRMGLVVTKEYGPRVRFAVVTTDMPLIHDKPVQFGVQDFCEICKKCATNCPSGAVEKGDKKVVRGVSKWQSSQEKCFRYWNRVGSDCSVCIKVCPYAHPNTPVHELIRWAIQRNPLVRRLALAGDDFFYGRRPKSNAPLPDWHAPS